MNWGLLIAQLAPTIISLLSNTSSALKTDTPISIEATALAISPPKASEAIKDLQKLLNVALMLNPPLDVDGWLGPKTENAIEMGIYKLKTMGIG